jgi:hypothetical protein
MTVKGLFNLAWREPMKCIKMIMTGQVYRAEDDTAAELVASGKYTYSSKGEWKRMGRAYL